MQGQEIMQQPIHIKELFSLSAKLPAIIELHQNGLAAISKRLTELKNQGLIYASHHWREGKYFYLVYPVKVGEKRKREYIGTDPDKIAVAQAAMARAVEYEALEKKQKEYEYFLTENLRVLRNVVSDLERKDVFRKFST